MANLQETLKRLNKDFKTGEIKVGIEFTELEKIPFKSPRLNYMTYGGLPLGRIGEFSGAEGSGKTTTSLDVVAGAQQTYPEKQVLFVDVESTFDPYWAKKMGVDSDNLIVYRPDSQSAEAILQAILDIVDTGDISLVVLDSIACMVSQQATQKTMEEKTYAGVSSALTTFSQKIIPVLARNHCLMIGINQLRDDMNSPYGGTTTPGGKAWKHACSVRLFFRKGKFIDEKGNELTRGAENPAGNIVNVALEKSKVFRSDRRIGFYTLNYIEGIDFLADFIDVAIKEDKIVQAGAWFTIPEYTDQKIQGKTKLKQFLKDNPEIYDKINLTL